MDSDLIQYDHDGASGIDLNHKMDTAETLLRRVEDYWGEHLSNVENMQGVPHSLKISARNTDNQMRYLRNVFDQIAPAFLAVTTALQVVIVQRDELIAENAELQSLVETASTGYEQFGLMETDAYSDGFADGEEQSEALVMALQEEADHNADRIAELTASVQKRQAEIDQANEILGKYEEFVAYMVEQGLLAYDAEGSIVINVQQP